MPDQNEERKVGQYEAEPKIDVAEEIANLAEKNKLEGKVEDLQNLIEDYKEKTSEQPKVVSPDMLLAEIVKHIGPDFVVIPMKGWGSIVEVIQGYKDEQLLDDMEALKVPVVPVSLSPKDKEEGSRIIMPTDAPKGESKIIV